MEQRGADGDVEKTRVGAQQFRCPAEATGF
jgi:hypothetical protein